MSDPTQPGTGNRGVQNFGQGSIHISDSAIGDQATVLVQPAPGPSPKPGPEADDSPWDVGVITVLSEETRAVREILAGSGECREDKEDPSGRRCCEAEVATAAGVTRVVATQAVDVGNQPTANAFEHLRNRYHPTVVALVGIAGGISPSVDLGDVVVVRQVIYYDLRKETPEGVVHRGQAQLVPPTIRHAMNDFFSSHGEPYRTSIQDQDGVSRDFKVLPGPIGSGEAVVANQDAEIRSFLRGFNDKTLALETETGGLAAAFYEVAASLPPGSGWLGIRGISDHADAGKHDRYHDIASWHAATILLQMLPYLKRG